MGTGAAGDQDVSPLNLRVEARTRRDGTKTSALVCYEPWSHRAVAMFRDAGCDSLEWFPPRDERSCDGLREISADLEAVAIVSEKALNDSAIQEMSRLKILDCLTRAKNELDLSRLESLEYLGIDDRDNLAGLQRCPAKFMRFSFTRRPLSAFSDCQNLENLTIEAPINHTVNTAASFPKLNDLGVLRGRVESLDELRAPHLVNFTLRVRRYDHVLDLAPLQKSNALKYVHVDGPTGVRGAEELRAAGVSVYIRSR